MCQVWYEMSSRSASAGSREVLGDVGDIRYAERASWESLIRWDQSMHHTFDCTLQISSLLVQSHMAGNMLIGGSVIPGKYIHATWLLVN